MFVRKRDMIIVIFGKNWWKYFVNIRSLLCRIRCCSFAVLTRHTQQCKLGTFLSSGCFVTIVILASDNVFTKRKNYHPLQEYSSFQARPSFCILTYNLLSSFEPGGCESCAAFPAKTEAPHNFNTRALYRHSMSIRCRVNRSKKSAVKTSNCANRPPSGKIWQLLVKPIAETPPKPPILQKEHKFYEIL